MHSLDLILTLTGGLAAALVAGYVTQRLGLSPIVGYLLAGVAVGPYTPGFVADPAMAEQFAEVGVILLMFGVGLQFHVDELLAVRNVAIPGAIAQSVAATVLGACLVQLFGWPWASGIVFGMALSVASTVVLIRVLADNNALHTRAGHIAVGWLVIEDLFTVIALVVLPMMFDPTAGGDLAGALAVTALKVGALVAFTAVVGTRVIPRALDHVAGTHSRELFTLTVLVIALGIAVASAKVFDVSMALGAFLAGLVVGRSDYALRAATEALPLRDAFAVLFFVSVGMLLDPGALLDSPALVAGTLAIVLVGKPLTAFAITWLMRYPFATGLSVAVALAQIGEFSFMLSRVGRDLGVLTAEAGNVIIAAAILSIVLNPLLFRTVQPLDRWTRRWPLLRRLVDRSSRAEVHDAPAAMASLDARRAIVVGYGPTGRTVTRLLRENGFAPTVIEMNVNAVRELREEGVRAVLGDATHPDTMAQAGAAQADALILTSVGMADSRETIVHAKALNPRIQVLARTAYLREVAGVTAAGADTVVSAEGEVALALTEVVLQRLGATRDQIDQERDRVRSELAAGSPPRGGS